MAGAATDVLSLAALKRELRIDPAETCEDEILSAQLQDAVSWVGSWLWAPLVDRTVVEWCIRPSDAAAPVLIERHSVKSASIRYWSSAGDLREEPDGAIAAAALGRIAWDPQGVTEIWPPADGWPTVLHASELEVSVVHGLDITPETMGLRQAVIVYARARYDGHVDDHVHDACFTLMAPWRAIRS